MYDPKTVLNEAGMRELQRHVLNMEEALFFLTNNADDLHIGALDPEQLEALYKVQRMIEGGAGCLLLNGDGEKEDEDG